MLRLLLIDLIINFILPKQQHKYEAVIESVG